MRVKFTDDYTHHEVVQTIEYKKGAEETVRADIGEAAIDAGKAEEVPLLKDQDEAPVKRKGSRGD